jgi:hypothetical protein
MEETEKETPNNPEQPISAVEGFGKGVNDYLNHNITVADAKAAAILATNFVLLGGLSGFCFCSCTQILVLITGVFAAVSILLCAIVLFPRLPKAAKGLIFWENIKQFKTMDEYIKEAGKLKEENVEEEYAKQNWHVSNVLSTKHKYIRFAIATFVVAFISLVILFIKFG